MKLCLVSHRVLKFFLVLYLYMSGFKYKTKYIQALENRAANLLGYYETYDRHPIGQGQSGGSLLLAVMFSVGTFFAVKHLIEKQPEEQRDEKTQRLVLLQDQLCNILQERDFSFISKFNRKLEEGFSPEQIIKKMDTDEQEHLIAIANVLTMTSQNRVMYSVRDEAKKQFILQPNVQLASQHFRDYFENHPEDAEYMRQLRPLMRKLMSREILTAEEHKAVRKSISELINCRTELSTFLGGQIGTLPPSLKIITHQIGLLEHVLVDRD